MVAVRRIASVLLPDLPCELVHDVSSSSPLAVVIIETAETNEEAKLGDVISAVNETARRFGVQVGQTVADARAKVANLIVRNMTRGRLRQALGRLAEVMMAFSPTVCIDSGDPSAPLDTVWIDLTSSVHLFGGEEATMTELAARARELGHRVRVALADGPRLAKSVATFGATPETIVAASRGKESLRDFPLVTLPLSRERVVWLNRLGLWTVSDLTKLPSEVLASRLGENWREALDLAQGRDETPLIPYEPPGSPTEDISWDESVLSIEPLLFTLRGMVSRLSARLEGRGLAAQIVELDAPYDRSIAKLRHVERTGLSFRIELPSPLAHKNDLFRVLKSKLEHSALEAPVTGLSVTARSLTHAPKMQLCLGTDSALQTDPRAMAILLAELSAEIGPENVGVIELSPVHRPEARTRLIPLSLSSKSSPDKPSPRASHRDELGPPSDVEFPTRLLREPIPLKKIPGGKGVSIDQQIFSIASIRHSMRLDQVEWWTSSPLCRDYHRVWLTSGQRRVQAWVFTDRLTGRSFLHGYFD